MQYPPFKKKEEKRLKIKYIKEHYYSYESPLDIICVSKLLPDEFHRGILFSNPQSQRQRLYFFIHFSWKKHWLKLHSFTEMLWLKCTKCRKYRASRCGIMHFHKTFLTFSSGQITRSMGVKLNLAWSCHPFQVHFSGAVEGKRREPYRL